MVPTPPPFPTDENEPRPLEDVEVLHDAGPTKTSLADSGKVQAQLPRFPWSFREKVEDGPAGRIGESFPNLVWIELRRHVTI